MIPIIRADCTELGLAVDASIDGGKTWHCVQLTPYKTRERGMSHVVAEQVRVYPSTVMQYRTWIDPAKDREEYFEELRARKIEFIESRATHDTGGSE